jgi:parvulin-like peptidyl-prolyl isomerase
MITSMKKLLKEPLLHFLLLGAAFFALNAWRERAKPSELTQSRIEVSEKTITWLCEGYVRQWHRAPDAAELRGLIQDHIREELLYREAQALGLDRDDTIVRRRMAQKMEFLTQDISTAAAPDEGELRAFFAANVARYAKAAQVTFRHVYFSKDRHGERLDADARAALDALRKGANEDSVGDPFLREHEFKGADAPEIASALGEEFATVVTAQPAGEWRGPVPSSYGVHLVFVTERTSPQPVVFESVREAVARDLMEDRRRTANSDYIMQLKARYLITVDEAALTKAAAPAPKTAQR